MKPVYTGMLAKDMAMDLGTANTLIYLKGHGIVINEPSVIAFREDNGKILAVGKEAKDYIGKTPQKIKAIRPLKDGVIDDFDQTKAMIKMFFGKVQNIKAFLKPKAVISVPAGVTQMEKRAIVQASEQAGLGEIFLMEEPMAAAIGADLDIAEEKPHMIIDIGGGTTEVALISRYATVCGESVRVAGDEMNEVIVAYVKRNYGMEIGENSAEQLKIKAGSAWSVSGLPDLTAVSGKDLIHNTAAEKKLTVDDLRKALKEPLEAVLQTVFKVLEKAPKAMLEDVKKEGIHMAGGGSLLHGLDMYIAEKTGISCKRTKAPLLTVVEGSGRVLEKIKGYKKVFIN